MSDASIEARKQAARPKLTDKWMTVADGISYYHVKKTAGDCLQLGKASRGLYLHDFSHQATYSILIDSFRLRENDNKVMGQELSEARYPIGHARMGQKILTVSQKNLREYLELVESRQGMKPQWWDDKRRNECLQKAQADKDFKLTNEMSQSLIIARYEDLIMPAKLRAFAAKVYGWALWPC